MKSAGCRCTFLGSYLQIRGFIAPETRLLARVLLCERFCPLASNSQTRLLARKLVLDILTSLISCSCRLSFRQALYSQTAFFVLYAAPNTFFWLSFIPSNGNADSEICRWQDCSEVISPRCLDICRTIDYLQLDYH